MLLAPKQAEIRELEDLPCTAISKIACLQTTRLEQSLVYLHDQYASNSEAYETADSD